MPQETELQLNIISEEKTREGLSSSIGGNQGLSARDVEERIAKGLINGKLPSASKSVAEIIRSNTITPFYLLNGALVAAIIIFAELKNATFIFAVLCNMIIGTLQELKAKHTLDKLSLITSPKVRVIRDGLEQEISSEELVIDDLMVLTVGNQICSDCEITEGQCDVDESMLTGEADPENRKVGDNLLSGSHVVSGRCIAKVTHVGLDNYATKISVKAKAMKKPKSEMMEAIDRIIKTIAIGIAPIGIILFLKQYFLLHATVSEAVTATVAACIGMIPEGLVLLTSCVLAAGIVKISQKGALVQELYSIEMLARVDTFCLDKTGTLTSGRMKVEAVNGSEDLVKVAAAVCAALGDESPTSKAILEYAEKKETINALTKIPFSSVRKWSGIWDGKRSYVMGAYQFLLKNEPEKAEKILPEVEKFTTKGFRVLLVAVSDESFGADIQNPSIPGDLRLLGLIAISDELRTSAPETMDYFVSQGVDIKIISGDDPETVSEIARRSKVPNAEKWVNMTENPMAAATDYTVFGRVSPEQKLQLVRELKAHGHTVAMMGDGVNDVMALKESDCSIAPAEGSDAAKHVSQVVLMKSDFDCLPRVVAEGRQSINNLQRSAALFLSKTIFAAIVSVIFLFLPMKYPLEPIQISLFSIFAIGIPSFILSLQPNHDRVKGRFLTNVLSKSVPGAVAYALAVLGPTLFLTGSFSPREVSAVAAFLMGLSGFLILFRVCLPFNRMRIVLFIVLLGCYTGLALAFPEFLSLVKPTAGIIKVLIPLAGAVVGGYVLAVLLWKRVERKILSRDK